MKIKNPRIRHSSVNSDFSISTTYPDTLLVPSGMSDDELRKVGDFRSMGRIPALSWLHPSNNSVMLRCSQPNAGEFLISSNNTPFQNFNATLLYYYLVGIIGTHCIEDEKLFGLVEVKYIFDARPKINAVANQMKGKG